MDLDHRALLCVVTRRLEMQIGQLGISGEVATCSAPRAAAEELSVQTKGLDSGKQRLHIFDLF